ncbi:MAG TPA: hypothetical protein VKM72_23240, partial [Thermoanaerobaculia bacterium]|nr:hypothetical protein [Thermoanaerobaculia bacterium]
MSPTSPRADRGSAETERPRPARPGVRRRLAAIHRELDSLAGEPDRWARSLVGGDLWVDGWRAVRSTDEHLFARYRDAFLDFCQQSGAAVRSLDEESLPSVLERFELFLEACAEANAGSFWPALAVGLALVQAVGGPPRIERSPEAAVANDSLLLIVSPSYRAIRCHAYNAGIATFCVPDSQVPVFRPELGHFLISPRYQVRHEPPRVQFYTVNHDLSHLVLFGDAYLRPVGSPAMTAALLLNAEETCCTLDLVLARDLDRFGIELNALAELLRIESGSKAGRPSVTQRVAREPAAFTAYQAALKAAAQERLTASTPVSLRIREGASLPS